MDNLLADLPDARPGEVITAIPDVAALGAGVRVERITSLGQASPEGFWYDQDEHEWVAVLAGWGELEWPDGRRRRLGVGDFVLLPAHTRHRVRATASGEPTVWLAVFWQPHGPGDAG